MIGGRMGLLQDKVVIVTGATSGIGRVTAKLFAEEGAKVALVGRRTAEGGAACDEITAAGGEAHFIQADLSVLDAIGPAIDEVVSIFGRLDLAFNNAGITGLRGRIEAHTPQTWDELMHINLRSAFFCMQAQAAHMIQQGSGAILFNASVLATIAFPGTSVYSASKGALVSMARAAAVELGPSGIRVNTISPSLTKTPMTSAGFVVQSDGTEIHPLAAATPLRRVADPIEVSRAALFLLSDMASFVTGQNLVLDGGLSAM
jgi:NAD(P)-dependent dehydrogenase (short-subunit alcohol dehydrogenase family)